MKRFKKFTEFINEMMINRNSRYKKLDLDTIHKFAEPHPTYDYSFSYYEKIGPFGLSLVGGDDQIDYDNMDPEMKKLYSILPPGSNKSRPLLKGDFIDDFEVAIFNWEGDDVTDRFLDRRYHVSIKEIDLARKKLFDISSSGYVGSIEDLISGGGSR